MFGGAGDDLFNNSRGDDLSLGGSGDDLFRYGATWGPVDEEEYDGDTGFDTLIYRAPDRDTLLDARPDVYGYGFATGGLSFARIERIEFEGSRGDDRVYLGSGSDLASGGSGDDVIRGYAGADDLSGGWGQDLLRGGSGNDDLHGDGGRDVLAGQRGDDFLWGGTGRDRLLGGSGDDALQGDGDGDRLKGGGGGDDQLSGGSGRDVLRGGAGYDDLDGGSGADLLHGGRGADAFVFRWGDDSRPGSGADVIRDFQEGLDIIDLGDLDANVRRGGEQAATFIGGDRFHGSAGELRYEWDWDARVVQIDRDGDARADMEIVVLGDVPLIAADFIL